MASAQLRAYDAAVGPLVDRLADSMRRARGLTGAPAAERVAGVLAEARRWKDHDAEARALAAPPIAAELHRRLLAWTALVGEAADDILAGAGLSTTRPPGHARHGPTLPSQPGHLSVGSLADAATRPGAAGGSAGGTHLVDEWLTPVGMTGGRCGAWFRVLTKGRRPRTTLVRVPGSG